MTHRDATSFLIVLALLAGLTLAAQESQPPAPAPAQPPVKKSPIPDTFYNLQVLPKDIAKPDLVAVMKSMAINLNVRCSHCHVATDDLSEANFPSDEKPTKKAAREMLRTIGEVSRKYPAPTAPAQ